MNKDFASAMGRALKLTRAGSAMEATRVIQAALDGGSAEAPTEMPRSAPKSRRPLGRVVDALSAARRALRDPGSPQRAAPPVPPGARYETRTYTGHVGARDYRLFVPSRRADTPAGLLLMLHGCTQTADDFAVGTRMNLVAEANNLIVIYPDQTRQANQMGCWNWFRPEDQKRGSGEAALLAALASAVTAEFGVASDRIFVAGLSAGGAMAAILGHTHPEIFAAVGVHSGLAAGAASDMPSAFAAMRGAHAGSTARAAAPVRTIVFHGDADATVAPSNADRVIEAALGAARAQEIEDHAPPGATVTLYRSQSGDTLAERWTLAGVGHAWSGGAADGSYTDPRGPDASAEMVRFFLGHAGGEKS